MESIKLYTEIAERVRAEGREPKVSYEVFNSSATTKGGYEVAKEYGYIPLDMTWEQYQDTYLEETPSPDVVSKSLQKTEEADEKRAEWARKREMLRALEPKLGEMNWETTFSMNEDERGNVDSKKI
jgi:hypothetical protein